MFIAMNRFKVRAGSEEAFEQWWRDRDSSLPQMQGFRYFHLLRGETRKKEGYTLFASHTVWESREDFLAWTKSAQFRATHRNAGSNDSLYLGHPQFEGFTVVEGA